MHQELTLGSIGPVPFCFTRPKQRLFLKQSQPSQEEYKIEDEVLLQRQHLRMRSRYSALSRLTRISSASMKSGTVPLSSCEKDFLLQGVRSRKVMNEGSFLYCSFLVRCLISWKITACFCYKTAFRWERNI